MGYLLSSTIADIVLYKFPNETYINLKGFGIYIKFLVKYDDDMLAIVKREETDVVLRQLKTYNKRLQYTIEMVQDKSLPFLNVKIH